MGRELFGERTETDNMPHQEIAINHCALFSSLLPSASPVRQIVYRRSFGFCAPPIYQGRQADHLNVLASLFTGPVGGSTLPGLDPR